MRAFDGKNDQLCIKPELKMKPITCLLGLLPLLLLACQPVERQHLAARLAVKGKTDRDALRNRLREQERILVVFPANTGGYRQYVSRLPANVRRGIRLEARPDTALTERELQEEVLLLIGTPASNQVIARLAKSLPFRFEDEALHFNGSTFTDPGIIARLSLFPNPLAPANPVMMTAGLDDEAVLAYLRQHPGNSRWGFGWSSLDFEFSIGGRRLLLGRFNDQNWKPDPALVFDFTATPDTVGRTTLFQFLAYGFQPPAPLLEELQHLYEADAARIQAFTGRRLRGGITVHLYGSAEEKGLTLEDTRRTQVEFDANSIHAVLNGIYAGKDDGMANRLMLRSLLGTPKTPLLELGLAVLLAENWQGAAIDIWVPRLQDAEAIPPLERMLTGASSEDTASLILPPLAASFTSFLIDSWGAGEFLKRYAEWTPTTGQAAALEKSWRTSIANSPQEAATASPLPFLRGFNFAHEGYAIYNGYGSRLATAALERLSALHANAVAIIPYSFLRDPQQPALIPILQRPGSENDESIVHSAAMAGKLGMTTVLKPQIWMGGGRWPGDIEMQNEAEWQAFFEYYSDWILHYAMLAEIHEFDLFCIGTELVRTTLAREADWRRLIRRIRKIYKGKLTYAANWGDEFEGIAFWDDLDFIGLNCYYPLSGQRRATDGELRAGFRRILAKVERIARRYERPVLFTEIGFPSVEAPWVQPHDDRRDVPTDDADQARCYRIVFEALQHQSWCGGILWWKYPSHPHESFQRDFTPMNKPAELVVAEWFNRLKKVN